MKRAAAIIIFGALPASALSLFAGFGVLLGFGSIVSGSSDPGEWGVFALGIGGLYGTLSLWLLAFRQASNFTFYGLLAGSLSLLVMIIIWTRAASIADLPILNLLIFGYVCVAPLAVAVILIVNAIAKRVALG